MRLLADVTEKMGKAAICLGVAVQIGCGKLMPVRQAAPGVEPPTADSALANLTEFQCPSSVADWQAWRDRELRKLISSRYTTNARYMAQFFAACQKSLSELPSVDRCTKNPQAFTRGKFLEKEPEHSLGLELSDSAYFAGVPDQAFFELPALLRNQNFLKALDGDTPTEREQAFSRIDHFNEEFARQEHNNKEQPNEDLTLHYIVFQSQNLPTPDDSQARTRLLVFVPHADYDQFVQFGLRDGPDRPLAQSTSIIVVQKRDLITKALLPVPQAYFNDLFRLRHDSQITFSTRLKENKNRLEPCTSCHSSALLPIVPDAASFDRQRFAPELQVINSKITAYGSAIPVHFNRSALGPALGSGAAQRLTDDAVRACFRNTTPDHASIERVRAAMACDSCHNDNQRGALTLSSIQEAQLPFGGNLLKRFVVDQQSMPPEATLSKPEREALVVCLAIDYSSAPDSNAGLFEQWLLQPDCHI